MFNQIKTSAKNKEVVTVLTRKFGLGAFPKRMVSN